MRGPATWRRSRRSPDNAWGKTRLLRARARGRQAPRDLCQGNSALVPEIAAGAVPRGGDRQSPAERDGELGAAPLGIDEDRVDEAAPRGGLGTQRAVGERPEVVDEAVPLS